MCSGKGLKFVIVLLVDGFPLRSFAIVFNWKRQRKRYKQERNTPNVSVWLGIHEIGIVGEFAFHRMKFLYWYTGNIVVSTNSIWFLFRTETRMAFHYNMMEMLLCFELHCNKHWNWRGRSNCLPKKSPNLNPLYFFLPAGFH